MIGRILRALRPVAPVAAPPPPFGVPVAAAMEAVEAADFIASDGPTEFDRFALIAMSLDQAVRRDREGMAMIEAIEATPRAHGRSHGLEWGYEQLFIDAVRLRQGAELLRILARHEPQVRAILAIGEARA